MAIETQQLPVAAIGRIVVVIVILMMDRQFLKLAPGELAATFRANVGRELEGFVTISRSPLFAIPTSFGDQIIVRRAID
jgi:hypothetical protein